jgi:hypothetical protein
MYVFSREETGAITRLILIAEKGLVELIIAHKKATSSEHHQTAN